MCDYSLMGIPNRLAKEGEDLVSHRFRTGAVGFASPTDLSITDPVRAQGPRFWSALKSFFNLAEASPIAAVCIPPGGRLILQDIPARLQHDLQVGAVEEVTFIQRTATAYSYRDAIRFKNGREVLLQELGEGQRVRVLDLSSAEAFEPVTEEQSESLFRRR